MPVSFSEYLSFPVSIIPPMIRTHISFIYLYNRRSWHQKMCTHAAFNWDGIFSVLHCDLDNYFSYSSFKDFVIVQSFFPFLIFQFNYLQHSDFKYFISFCNLQFEYCLFLTFQNVCLCSQQKSSSSSSSMCLFLKKWWHVLLSVRVTRNAVRPGATRFGQSFGSAHTMGVSPWCSTHQGVFVDCNTI
jgi:hypothetical protein